MEPHPPVGFAKDRPGLRIAGNPLDRLVHFVTESVSQSIPAFPGVVSDAL